MKPEDIKSEAAATIARHYLARCLIEADESPRSDIARLNSYTTSISRDLESGGRPDKNDIDQAEYFLKRTQSRLDEVKKLFGYTTAEQGAKDDSEALSASDQQGPEIPENSVKPTEDSSQSSDESRPAEKVINDDELVALRSNVEEGITQAQYNGADQEATAQLLELYARYVREGHAYPPSRRGSWNRNDSVDSDES